MYSQLFSWFWGLPWEFVGEPSGFVGEPLEFVGEPGEGVGGPWEFVGELLQFAGKPRRPEKHMNSFLFCVNKKYSGPDPELIRKLTMRFSGFLYMISKIFADFVAFPRILCKFIWDLCDPQNSCLFV